VGGGSGCPLSHTCMVVAVVGQEALMDLNQDSSGGKFGRRDTGETRDSTLVITGGGEVFWHSYLVKGIIVVGCVAPLVLLRREGRGSTWFCQVE
jgi:hypothetical protein